MARRQTNSLDDRVAFALAKVGALLVQREREDADRHGLYPTQLRILDHALADEGRATPSELALVQGVSLATISDSLAAMESKGLITRERSTQDARRVVIRLTARGRRIANHRRGNASLLTQLAGSLQPHEQTALLAATQKLVAALQNERQAPTNAMCINCTFFRANAYGGAIKPHHCAFLDVAFGNAQLQTNCPDFEVGTPATREHNAKRFADH